MFFFCCFVFFLFFFCFVFFVYVFFFFFFCLCVGIPWSLVIRASSLSPLFFEMKHRPLEPLQYDDRKMLTILFLGDIVGEPGRSAVIARLPELKEKYALDFIIVNGENTAGGRGITGKSTIDLLRAGVSVITTGDHIWDQKEIFAFIDTEPRLLRPINYPEGAPGNGSIVLETAKGKVGVINVQMRTFMQPILENPFPAVEAAVAAMRQETPGIFVDAHA